MQTPKQIAVAQKKAFQSGYEPWNASQRTNQREKMLAEGKHKKDISILLIFVVKNISYTVGYNCCHIY